MICSSSSQHSPYTPPTQLMSHPSSPPSALSTAQDSSPSRASKHPPHPRTGPHPHPRPDLRRDPDPDTRHHAPDGECSDITRLCPRPYVNLARTSPVGGASSDFARTWYSATERGKGYTATERTLPRAGCRPRSRCARRPPPPRRPRRKTRADTCPGTRTDRARNA
ncbi:hypothetical protein B0H13DRAFT_2658000, partial [Mycena leptocephala]